MELALLLGTIMAKEWRTRLCRGGTGGELDRCPIVSQYGR